MTNFGGSMEGAVACLKCYTDPSFFKAESEFSGAMKLQVQREKKIRKGRRNDGEQVISEMGSPTSIANIFAARNITTTKEALSLIKFELMELLDMGMVRVTFVVAHISQIISPPTQTALSLME